MEELRELYDSIENPLNNPETIQKLIESYANKDGGAYYTELTRTVNKQHSLINTQDADRFHAMVFNKWKNNIVGMTRERFIELRSRGSYADDFIKLRKFLKTVPDVSTRKEARTIMNSRFDDIELEDAMEKYKWNARGETSGWIHVCSRDITAKAHRQPKVEHRLYLDTDSTDTYEMVINLIKKFDQHKLPYYFKFDEAGNRDDTIVIYSDTENLINYIQLLEEIKQENPELVSRAKKPPILTGKIDNWIGYGSEPERDEKGNKRSFNQVRADLIEASIDKITKRWIKENRNNIIRHNGQKMTFQDYIGLKATDKTIQKLNRPYKYKSKYETNEDIAKRKGYTIDDLQSQSFRRMVHNVIASNMGNALTKVCDGNDMQSISIDVRNGKKIEFTNEILKQTISSLAIEIAKHDEKFSDDIKREITKNASQYGIDPIKFCFDEAMKDKMLPEGGWAEKTHGQEQVSVTEKKENAKKDNENVNRSRSFKDTLKNKREKNRIGLSNIEEKQSEMKGILDSQKTSIKKRKYNGQNR